MNTVIRSQSELQALRRRHLRRGLREITLDLPGNRGEIRRAERTINHSLRACGCGTGAVFMVAGLATTGLVHWLGPPFYAVFSVQNLAATFAFLMATTFAGKMTGLAIADWKLRAAIERLS
ncbi:hypothetical protein [Arthrobacter sp. ZGTC131]|uniref:hypothetical protein n=1 Tax=Arthrobacter sp. ZGTC131 TaxID=2058898 RepID=UPI000CE4FB51|nr:hypothetical protein [Arthrobacter sp. ZGTC131]